MGPRWNLALESGSSGVGSYWRVWSVFPNCLAPCAGLPSCSEEACDNRDTWEVRAFPATGLHPALGTS